MLCAIYKSLRQPGVYLFIEKRDDFSAVPEDLLKSLGRLEWVMLFNLLGVKPLAQADNLTVLEQIQQQGFYLQVPPPIVPLKVIVMPDQVKN